MDSELNDKFPEEVKKEIILLSDLKNVVDDKVNNFYIHEFRPFNSNQIITSPYKKEKSEVDEKIMGLKKECLEKYYKLEEEKTKELESSFRQLKLKVEFEGIPRIFKDGIIYTGSESFITCDTKFFNKIFEIQFQDKYNIFSAVQLDNKDLVLASKRMNRFNELLIYRKKNEEYSLLQLIKENKNGYPNQYVSNGWCGNSVTIKSYGVIFIKGISGNRFICVNNYGFKIYSLNEQNEYVVVLLNEHSKKIEIIQEINPNKFIFCSQYKSSSFYRENYGTSLIEIVELKEITKEEILRKLNEVENRRYNIFYGTHLETKEENGEGKKLIESLKLTYISKVIIECNRNIDSNLNGYAIIKNKYFIITLHNNILLFDLINGKLLKRYELLIDAQEILNDFTINIQKWNNVEDNEFILQIKGNIILFELNEDKTEIKLKLISYSYFPDFNNCEPIRRLTEKSNRFYVLEENFNYGYLTSKRKICIY